MICIQLALLEPLIILNIFIPELGKKFYFSFSSKKLPLSFNGLLSVAKVKYSFQLTQLIHMMYYIFLNLLELIQHTPNIHTKRRGKDIVVRHTHYSR